LDSSQPSDWGASTTPASSPSPPAASLSPGSDPTRGDTTVAMSPPAGQFSSGNVLGNRYRIVALLGRGGMGEVWQAYDLKLQVEVALKSILPGRFAGDGGLELLRNEVRSAREVISPNVCRIFDLVEEDGREFVSMEYVDGKTLLALLRERSPLAIPEATRIATQFLSGLEAIHQAGLVHRDVKPENIMITRTGRVLLMDFGIAKGVTEDQQGTIAGTPAYMAPEQARGEAIDARADIFAAGVTLAEMIAPAGLHDHTSRKSIWDAVRHEPVQLFDSPWRRVLERAVAASSSQRYASARELVRALEEVPQRIEGAEDRRPYPGLASFTEADREFFFGREVEVEAVWKKLQRAYLLALIGASGAGKTSFVHAGLIPAMPEGWRHVVIRPSSAPFAALGQALVPELVGDVEATQALVRLDDPQQALLAVGRWRAKHAQVLLVVDQFEELFTLCDTSVQSGFADLLGRLAIEADVHVLLSMRDDFLLRCTEHTHLAPVLADLTALNAPTGGALRRALVQPALLCGYRFEDESLADEMLDAVVGERGALPLVAFAASRLWESRDRERGQLTRAAYEGIGGVMGALAQHAEATLERIGPERESIVREMFRNLVTAQGTRAVIEVEELLSVFEDGAAAESVLRELVDARLLTTFETEEQEGKPRRRVEVVHESLLARWPRLVRWQSQDADSAHFRDQLRQQARLWNERGRADDLLWTGSSYREFALWRERYLGGLTATEEAYTQAMTLRAERLRRRRRRILAGTIVSLAVVVAVVTGLWIRAQIAQRRGEGRRLVALGRVMLPKNPTVGLAYAIASVEKYDEPEARHFAMEALLSGPHGIVLDPAAYPQLAADSLGWGWWNAGLHWSPDGRWLAVGEQTSGVTQVWSRDGGPPLVLRPPPEGKGGVVLVRFGPNSDVLLTRNQGDPVLRFWSIPGGELVRTFDLKGRGFVPAEPYGLVISVIDQEKRVRKWEALSYSTGELTPLGRHTLPRMTRSLGFDPSLTWYAFARGDSIFAVPLQDMETAKPRLLGVHPGVKGGAWHRGGSLLATSAGDTPPVRVWSTAATSSGPLWTIDTAPDYSAPTFDPAGTRLAIATYTNDGAVHDLRVEPGTSPARFTPIAGLPSRAMPSSMMIPSFHPEGTWLAITAFAPTTIFPLSHPYPRKLYQLKTQSGVRFTPDGRRVLFGSTNSLHISGVLSSERAPESRVLLTSEGVQGLLFLETNGKQVITTTNAGPLLVVPLDGGGPRRLEACRPGLSTAVISADGRYAAVSCGATTASDRAFRIIDLVSGDVRTLGHEGSNRTVVASFLPDGRLLTQGLDGVELWNLPDTTSVLLRSGASGNLMVMPDGRHVRWTTEQSGRWLDIEMKLLEWGIYDLQTGKWEPLTRTPADYVLNRDGTLYSYLDQDTGILYVGRIRNRAGRNAELEEASMVCIIPRAGSYDLSPDGKQAVVGCSDGSVYLVPVPQGPPLQTLPRKEFLTRLGAMTNVRAVADPAARDGYKLVASEFPGWKTIPDW
jgi:WD40 repeat protein